MQVNTSKRNERIEAIEDDNGVVYGLLEEVDVGFNNNFQAINTQTGELVHIKIMQGDSAQQQYFREYFASGTISEPQNRDIPGIQHILLPQATAQDYNALIFPLMDGSLSEREFFSWDEVYETMTTVSEAMNAWWHLRLTHHDLKLENILFEGIEIKVNDFGLMQHPDFDRFYKTLRHGPGNFPVERYSAGTHVYLPSEKFEYLTGLSDEYDPHDIRIDIHGAGIVLWEMMVGPVDFFPNPYGEDIEDPDQFKREYEAGSIFDEWCQHLDVGSGKESLPENLLQIAFTAFHPNPDRRYQDPIELRQAIELAHKEYRASNIKNAMYDLPDAAD